MVYSTGTALTTLRSQRRLSRASFIKDALRVRENLSGPTVVNIKDTSRMAKRMVMAHSSSQMETFILASLTRARCMASLYSSTLRGASRDMESGAMESGSHGLVPLRTFRHAARPSRTCRISLAVLYEITYLLKIHRVSYF